MSKNELYFNLDSLEKYLKELEVQLDYEGQLNQFKKPDLIYHDINLVKLKTLNQYPIKLKIEEEINLVLSLGVVKSKVVTVLQPYLFR